MQGTGSILALSLSWHMQPGLLLSSVCVYLIVFSPLSIGVCQDFGGRVQLPQAAIVIQLNCTGFPAIGNVCEQMPGLSAQVKQLLIAVIIVDPVKALQHTREGTELMSLTQREGKGCNLQALHPMQSLQVASTSLPDVST